VTDSVELYIAKLWLAVFDQEMSKSTSPQITEAMSTALREHKSISGAVPPATMLHQ
jgi:hypothetical protein